MYRSRSSLSYEILHGIHFPANFSVMLAYLNYFPPPPPMLPAPPPRRSWTCSSQSYSSLSCFVSDDRNPPSLRQYLTLNNYNQSILSKNVSHVSPNPPHSVQSSSLFNYLINLFHQNQFSFIFFSILILSILLFLICLIIVFLYFQRHRQRQLTSNNKNNKFYYRLIPRRQKPQRVTNNNNEQKLVRLRKPSTTTQVIRIGGIHTKNHHETEEAV